MDSTERWATHLSIIQHDSQSADEAFFNLAYHLSDILPFPLIADWLGLEVTVTAVNLDYSSHSHGLKMDAHHQHTPLPIEELNFQNLDTTTQAWLDFYTYFREEIQ